MAKKALPEYVTIRLMDYEPHGYTQTVFRMTREAKQEVNDAAKLLRISAAQFIRSTIAQAARGVLSGRAK